MSDRSYYTKLALKRYGREILIYTIGAIVGAALFSAFGCTVAPTHCYNPAHAIVVCPVNHITILERR